MTAYRLARREREPPEHANAPLQPLEIGHSLFPADCALPWRDRGALNMQNKVERGTNFSFEPIGIVHSCFKQKFGIPRQAGLAPEAEGRLEILPPYNRPEAFHRLEEFSHVWLSFVFHATLREGWSPMVRPPRLGGQQKVGVFASRSPFRPNPIGLSVCELRAVDISTDGISLRLGGIDLLDGTPVLDIKPYLPYADALPQAQGGYSQPASPGDIPLHFSAAAEETLQAMGTTQANHLRRLLQQILREDPRPAYLQENSSQREFGVRLYRYNIRWRIEKAGFTCLSIRPIEEPGFLDDKG